MPDRHDDDVDSWLRERIDPLAPPPGTFEQIKRRARHRKYRKLAVTAASAAVIVAAAVTVPQVVNLRVSTSPSSSANAAGRTSVPTATGGGHAASSSARPASASATPPAPVPSNFQPSSVTFVGPYTGWVIGQAGTPGKCASQYCTSVATTGNAGQTWTGVPAPLTGAPSGSTGVGQIRFLNLTDGWAFGPELFVTHDAGHTWTQVGTNGLRVTDLETVGNRAFALFASCQGATFAAGCTSFTLYSSPDSGTGDWTPVGTPTTGLTNGAANEAASLVLTGSRGFLLAPGGQVYAGPVNGSGPWELVNSISSSCPVGPAKANGQPADALFGAVTAKELLLTCLSPNSSGGQNKLVFSSLNGGGSWIPVATAPTAGAATSVAASPSETFVLATNQGIDVLPAGDIGWQTATLNGQLPAGGFGYVGMTTDTHGIALPADPASGTVWFTFNGGRSWAPSHLSGS
jgi:hypothetical protein